MRAIRTPHEVAAGKGQDQGTPPDTVHTSQPLSLKRIREEAPGGYLKEPKTSEKTRIRAVKTYVRFSPFGERK